MIFLPQNITRSSLKISLLLVIALGFSLASEFSVADQAKTVNVLSWYGYLSEDTVKLIQDKCHVALSYDVYKSNDNMLRKWRSQENKYDVIIFSNALYSSIDKQIALHNSNLWKKSKFYNPTIYKNYTKAHFPPNVAYFSLALTGFVWNRKILNLTKNETIESAFSKAKNNKVILLDDPVEINRALRSGLSNNKNNDAISLSNLKRMTKNATVFISNEMNQIYGQKDFALSFQWSGDAVTNLISDDHKFLINNNLSYITTDLIAQLKDNPQAACTANELAGKEFLTILQNRTGYFSPYGNIDKIPEGNYKELYKEFLKELTTLHWVEQPSSLQLKKLNQKWDMVKYELSKDIE